MSKSQNGGEAAPFSGLNYNGFGKAVFDEMIESFADFAKRGDAQYAELMALTEAARKERAENQDIEKGESRSAPDNSKSM